jgi:hypothetical protein
MLAYELLYLRFLEQDAMMWDAPALSMTAQAFLMTIALGSSTSDFARIMASSLAIVVAVMAMQLMAKHRFLAGIDEAEIIRLEDELELPRHGRRRGAWKDDEYQLQWPKTSAFRKRSSYVVWQLGIGLFGCGAITVLVVTVLAPGLLRS